MGARNVSACYAMWAHLDHAPFRLLAGMALQTLDAKSEEGRPPRTWFGGEEGLVELMGRSRSAAYRALGALRKAGAVEVLDAGRNDHRAVYRLHLDPSASVAVSETQQPVDNSGDGTSETGGSVAPTATRKGRTQRDGKGRTQRDSRVALSATPRNHQGGTEESREGDISSKVPVSPAAVDDDADPDSTLTDAERTERHNRQLIERHGLIPALRLIDGGKTA